MSSNRPMRWNRVSMSWNPSGRRRTMRSPRLILAYERISMRAQDTRRWRKEQEGRRAPEAPFLRNFYIDFCGWFAYTKPNYQPHLFTKDCMAQPFNILVVDDEDALRNVLSSELQSEGYSVVSAADGDEAISILQQKSFDLVLLDIKMPRVDGFEVLRFIKERYANTKVIMLTGFADLKNAIESKKLGAEDFVSKPYDLVDLLTTIERVLSAE
ncbi:MAG: response regulator [Bacteroidetes bacterium]|nr:MAG: response regulator [Bacteroidota bacterium]